MLCLRLNTKFSSIDRGLPNTVIMGSRSLMQYNLNNLHSPISDQLIIQTGIYESRLQALILVINKPKVV